jgi:hypothetical protein
MVIRGELTCMSCGRYNGDIQGDPGRPFDKSWLVPGSAPTQPRLTSRGLYCGRCGGRVMLERSEKLYSAA